MMSSSIKVRRIEFTPRNIRCAQWLIASLFPFSAVVIFQVFLSWNGLPANHDVSIALVVLIGLVTTSAITDVIWQKIPNWATYSAAAWGFVLSIAATVSSSTSSSSESIAPFWTSLDVSESLLGGFACFGCGLLMYLLAGGGAGDAKLAGAIGFLVGLDLGLLVFCYAVIFAGVGALAVILWTRGPLAILQSLGRNLVAILVYRTRPPLVTGEVDVLHRTIPMAPFFALATLFAVSGASPY